LRDRIKAVPTVHGIPDRIEAAAVLGGGKGNDLTIGAALDAYWMLAADKTIGKSDDQLRRWKNPRIKAIKNLIGVIGDKPIANISADDMLDFRQWWLERMQSDGLTANVANKDLIHIGDVLKTVNKMKRLGLDLPLSGLSFKEGDAATRPPFSETWIKDKILAPGALGGLNDQAHAILLVMVNTGARPSELAALTPECIRLDHAVPHISIEAVGRQLKTGNAKRVIPLVGVSLEALRGFPDGFPRYRGSSATLSGTVSKFLRSQGLAETPDHTLYSLRHSFEDRLLAAGVDERIRRDLFGHALNRERYGAGAALAHLRDVIQAVAL
jgi:integrase